MKSHNCVYFNNIAHKIKLIQFIGKTKTKNKTKQSVFYSTLSFPRIVLECAVFVEF